MITVLVILFILFVIGSGGTPAPRHRSGDGHYWDRYPDDYTYEGGWGRDHDFTRSDYMDLGDLTDFDEDGMDFDRDDNW